MELDKAAIRAIVEALKTEDGDAALKICEDLLAGPEVEEPPTPLSGTGDPPPDAVATALTKLTGCPTVDEAIERWATMSARISKLDAESAGLDLERRRELVGELVKLGVEFPSTAWEGKPEDRKPCKRLSDEPIAELRSRVALHRAAPRTPAAPPVGELPDGGGVTVKWSKGEIVISPREVKNCKTSGITLEAYAENKAIREAAKRGGK